MLVVSDLRKAYGDTVVADGMSFALQEERITCLLAPSGAGKTSLLRVMAGLEEPSTGSVTIDGRRVDGPGPTVVLLPQAQSLFPHLKAREQIRFGPSLRRNRKRQSGAPDEKELSELTDVLGLGDLLTRYPKQLSGGQRQRLGLARALAVRPRYLLCDEPFSALDERGRQDLRDVLRHVQQVRRLSVLFVTHAVEEAAFLGDEIWLGSGPPLRIDRGMTVPLERTRSREVVGSEAFLRLCQRIRAMHLDLRSAAGTAQVGSRMEVGDSAGGHYRVGNCGGRS